MSGVVVARHISRIAAIFDAAPIGVGVWSVDGHLLHANPVLCDLLDADPASLAGRPIDAVVPPGDIEAVRAGFDEIWRGVRNAFSCRFACGSEAAGALVVRAELTAVYGPAGLPEYLLSQIFDFTSLGETSGGAGSLRALGAAPGARRNDRSDLSSVARVPPVGGAGSAASAAATGSVPGAPAPGSGDLERLRSRLAATEAELAEVRRLFRAVIEVGPIAVVRLDATGRVTYANGRWAEFLDDHQDRLSGRNWQQLLDPGQRDEVFERGLESLETGEPFEFRIASNAHVQLALDPKGVEPGADYWAVLQVAPVFEPNGEHDGWVATLTDVTAEVVADTRADQLAKALDAGTDFLMIAERTGAISYANDAARTRLGVHAGDAGGPPSFLMDMLEADSFEAWHELVHPTLLQGGVWNGELVLQTVTGEDLTVSAMFHAHCDRDGFLESIFAVARDISDLKVAERQLHQMATHDYLTGMPNRVLLYDRLEQALARYERYGQAVALLYVDLDRFKEVNDQHGHHVGDAVLRSVADRVHELVRDSDTAARVGGDEFCLLVEGISDLPTLKVIADRLIAAISTPIVIGDVRAEIGASVGLVLVDERSADVDALMALADAAMYRAKDSGRGMSYLYEPGSSVDARG